MTRGSPSPSIGGSRHVSLGMAVLISLVLLVAGQLLLIAGLSQTRMTESPNRNTVGVAILSADSGRYLEQSSSWAAMADAPWNYASYLLLLRLGHVLGSPETLAVASNVLFAVLAGSVLLSFCAERAGIGAGLAAASLLLLNPFVSQWVRFVLTDSIFMSVIALTVVALIRLLEADRRQHGMLISLVALTMWATFIKPHGLLLLGLVGSPLTYLVLRAALWRSRRRRIVLLSLAAVPWVLVLLLLPAGATSYNSLHSEEAVRASGLVANYYRGLVQSYDPPILISMPMARDAADVSATGLLSYALEYPAAVLRLFVARMTSALLQMRDHYPSGVNHLVGLFMVGYLTAAAYGLRTAHGGPLRSIPMLFFFGFLGFVAVTWSVAEGRYGWYALTALMPLSALGLVALLEQFAGIWTTSEPNHRA